MITTQFLKMYNALLEEYIVQARIINMQTMEFDEWCEHLADGSTVTAADVSAVMKQIEKRLPTILGFNTKVICSPEGLTFRPKVSGSITQSELKTKLEAKKAAETDPVKAAKIDVNRELATSDLSVSDCTVSIVVDLPKEWSTAFMQKAKLKRVKKTDTEIVEVTEDDGNTGTTENNGITENSGTTETTDDGGGTTPSGGGSDDNGGGDNGGGGHNPIDTGN